MKRVAVVTGANRGLGFETCRQLGKKGYQIILAARSQESGTKAAQTLKEEGLDVIFQKVDVTSKNDILHLRDFLMEKCGRVDVLVNNAGILPDPREPAKPGLSTMETDVDILRKAMETNTYGAFQLCQALLPLMEKNGYGRVVNVSSGMGQLSEMNGGYPGYRISKTALNALTRIFADEMEGKNILVNSICPGWVKTDMGGPGAHREITEGVDTIIWAATLPDGGPTGGFFRDREPIPW